MNTEKKTFTAIDPRLWGKSTWEFLDTIVATYPHEKPSLEHRDAVFTLMDSLAVLLPCPLCREHYKDFRKRNSLSEALNSRDSFIDFYYNFQKEIAERNNTKLRFNNTNDMWKQMAMRLKLVSEPVPMRPTTKPLQQNKRLVPEQRSGHSISLTTRTPPPAKPVKKPGCACNGGSSSTS